MATINKIKIGGTDYDLKGSLLYGVCETAENIGEKTVTVDGSFSLYIGATVIVKFTNKNSVASPTLNVNNSGGKYIACYGTTKASTDTSTNGWVAGAVQLFVYDGTNWVRDYWNNTTYTNASLGQGYSIDSRTSNSSTITATLSSYNLIQGGIVSVLFKYNVPTGATLNINNKGAKNIYYRNGLISGDIIFANDLATFIYDSSSNAYHLIALDRWQQDIAGLKQEIGTLETEFSDVLQQVIGFQAYILYGDYLQKNNVNIEDMTIEDWSGLWLEGQLPSIMEVAVEALSNHTHNIVFKPEGTISTPIFSGSSVNSGVNDGEDIAAVTQIGSTGDVSGFRLSFTPIIMETKNVAATGHKHSVVAAGTISTPTFSGKEVNIITSIPNK